jgi:hypothetical protein
MIPTCWRRPRRAWDDGAAPVLGALLIVASIVLGVFAIVTHAGKC